MKTERNDIPFGWYSDQLDEIATRGSGHTPDRSMPTYWNGGIRWISLKDSKKLDKIFINETEDNISATGLRNSSAVLYPAGTVVLCREAGVGKSAITTQDMAVSQDYVVWRCGDKLYNRYLYYWLQSMRREFERVAAGSTIKSIGLPYFRKLRIIYPPLREQHKIADILTDWDRAIEVTAELIAAQHERKHGLMQQLLTGKHRFPRSRNWSWRPISDVFRCVTRFESWDDGKTYIQAIVKRWSQGIEIRPPLLGRDIKTKNLQVIHKGDFLISDIQASYGAMSMVRDRHDGLYVSNVYTILVPRGQNQIYTPYFDQLSRTPFMRHLVAQSSNGFKAERIRLSFVRDAFLRQKIFLPDEIAEQRSIADLLDACDHELALLEQKLVLLRQQQRGLMQQLLTGKVRVSA